MHVPLRAGSALVMAGRAQEVWQHQLPLYPAPPLDDGADGGMAARPRAPHRISLTFRSIVPGFEDELQRRNEGELMR